MSRIGSSLNIQGSYDATLKRRILSTLGYKILADINEASVVMPTALVGTVILTLRGRGVGKSELIRRVDWLCERVRSRGGKVAHFANLPTSTVVERALEVLGPGLVGVVGGLPEPTYYAVDRFQLSFYRNMTIHLFVSEALVCAAVYTKVKKGGGLETPSISYKELYDYVYFLSQVSASTHVFPPSSSLTYSKAIPCGIHLSHYSFGRKLTGHSPRPRSGRHLGSNPFFHLQINVHR